LLLLCYPAPVQRARLLFVAKFLALVIVLYVVISLEPVDRTFIASFTHGLTLASAGLLRLFGVNVQVAGTTMRDAAFAVDVKNGCNGIEALILLVSAILAFGGPWKARIWGVIGGALFIEVINLIRIATLFEIGKTHPALFEQFHLVIWQSVIILLSVVFFVLWSSRVAPRAAA
jgi:exosortase H (IPTLxxWG-CTERM-specific)